MVMDKVKQRTISKKQLVKRLKEINKTDLAIELVSMRALKFDQSYFPIFKDKFPRSFKLVETFLNFFLSAINDGKDDDIKKLQFMYSCEFTIESDLLNKELSGNLRFIPAVFLTFSMMFDNVRILVNLPDDYLAKYHQAFTCLFDCEELLKKAISSGDL